MKVAIVGSRSITMDAYSILERYVPKGASEIISGGSDGADVLAEEYALRHHLPLKIFRPDYSRFGKAAPLQRNIELIRYSEYVIILWDGKSRGTAHVIDNCIKEYTPLHLLMIRNGKLVDTLFGQESNGYLFPKKT